MPLIMEGMSAILQINLNALLRCRGVESERVEFKASWNPNTTGVQVLRTICAFANDYHNINGGYIVIGVAERDGRAVLPRKACPPETSLMRRGGFGANATVWTLRILRSCRRRRSMADSF